MRLLMGCLWKTFFTHLLSSDDVVCYLDLDQVLRVTIRLEGWVGKYATTTGCWHRGPNCLLRARFESPCGNIAPMIFLMLLFPLDKAFLFVSFDVF